MPTKQEIRRLGRNRDINGLIEYLDIRNIKLKVEIIRALTEIGDSRTVKSLMEVLENGNNDLQKQRAAEALGKIGDFHSIEGLIDLMGSENTLLRRNSVKALAKINDHRTAKALVNSLEDSDEWVRWQIVNALGEIKHPSVVPHLITTLNDPSNYVRLSSAISLGNIRDKRAVAPLAKKLKDNDKNIRANVAASLGKIGHFEAIEELKKARKNNYGHVKKNIDSAIREIKRKKKYMDKVERKKEKMKTLFHCPFCKYKTLLIKKPKFCPKCENALDKDPKSQDNYTLKLKSGKEKSENTYYIK